MSDTNNEIEKFDPATLMQGVKDRIKAQFVSLIPDDKWEEMCEAEMKKFFEPRKINKGTDYSPNWQVIPSEFETMVNQLMHEKTKEYIKELLDSPDYQINKIWDSLGVKVTLSNHLDTMVKEKMPEIMMTFFQSFLANGISAMFAQFQNNIVKQY